MGGPWFDSEKGHICGSWSGGGKVSIKTRVLCQVGLDDGIESIKGREG